MLRSNKPPGRPRSLRSSLVKRIGHSTRGKTASNRLRRVDNFVLLYEPSLLTRTDGLFCGSMFVDLGYGFDPRTTLESAERFRRINPNLKILGVEIDKERVDAAQPYADEKTFFRLGGFNLPLQTGEHVRLIRAFNVLRQYEEKDFVPAYEMLAQNVLPGGLMVEGTSNPFGSIWCANVARRCDVMLSEAKSSDPQMSEILRSSDGPFRVMKEWRMEALVFSTNFRLGFEAGEFQTILPKNLIHRVVPGESIHDFFEAWKGSAAEMSPMKVYGAKHWFISTAERMAVRGYDINVLNKWLSRGYLIWKQG